MAYATGLRIMAALCFFIGGVTIIGSVVLWPLGYLFWKRAKEKEDEREQELEALSNSQTA